MNTICRPFALLVLLLLLTGCGSKDFELDFDLADDISDTYRIVYYASDKRGGYTVESAVPLMQGKAKLKLATVRPALLYVYGRSPLPMVLYAEAGDKIRIAGNTSDPWGWKVTGNKTDQLLSEWTSGHADIWKPNQPAERNAAVASFVADNPGSPIAPLLILAYVSRSDNETLFRQLWQRLPDTPQKEQWQRLAARSDMPGGRVRTPGRLLSMAMRSQQNGTDTIRPADAGATLLFFWHNGFEPRKEAFDSIRALAREYSDSASRIIADINLDADSIVWTSPLSRDSLTGTARLWAPAGLADTRLAALEVRRSPYWMVLSPDGHQRYRGTDRDSAFKTFRTLLN